MTGIAAWIAQKRAASEPLADKSPWVNAVRHQIAFPPATTRRLLDAVEALDALMADVQDYPAWERPCAAVDRAKAALDALRGGGGE